MINSFSTLRAAKMLALLAVVPGGKLSRERLADQLWPDDFQDATRLRLRQEIHRLKRSLGPASTLLGSSATDVWLNKDQVATDLDVLRQAASGSVPFPIETLSGALLPGWDDLWVVAERLSAEKQLVRAGIASAKQLLEAGNSQLALQIAQKLIVAFPLDEDLRMIAVNAHAKLGSMAAAMSEYQDFRRQAKTHLGVEPSRSLELLVQELAKLPLKQAEGQFGPGWESSIPEPLDELIGRETLLQHVLQEVQKRRLVSLIGPGGIGKTRLALEAARRISDQSERAVAFATLSDVADPGDWTRSVLSQIGSDAPVDSDAHHYLAALLSQGPTLLVLDNVETILPESADSIQTLLRDAPELRILTTSLVPTKLALERTIPVGPLDSRTSGVELLKQSLTQSRRDSLDAFEGDLVAVAERLDGYPLALRLVGARLRLLSPRDLLSQLDQALSNTTATDLPERHRTLRSALEGTMGSLSSVQIEALRRIWAYPGGLGMGLAAVEFGAEPYLDLIESLLDGALLVVQDHRSIARVRLLEPVRRFMDESLGNEEKAELRANAFQNVLRHMMDVGIAPWTPVSVHALEKLNSEAENLRAAWVWSLAHAPKAAVEAAPAISRFEHLRGSPRRLMGELASLADKAKLGAPEIQAAYHLAYASTAFGSTRENEGLPSLDRVAELLRELRAPHLETWHAVCLAAHALRRDLPRVDATSNHALSLAEAYDIPYAAARAYRIQAMVRDYRGQDQDLALLDRVDRLYRQVNADTDWAPNAIYFAVHLWFAGEYDRSLQLLKEARAQIDHCPDQTTEAYLYEAEGRLAIEEKKFESAEAAFRESLRLWKAIGSPYQEADQLHSLTKALIAQGKWAEARRTIVVAAAKWVEDGNQGGLCCSLVLLGRLLFQEGRAEDAIRVVGMAKALEERNKLGIVRSELDIRAELENELGGVPEYIGELSTETAAKAFELIR